MVGEYAPPLFLKVLSSYRMLVVAAGYGILISDSSAAVKYFATFLTVAGVAPCIATAITWIGK
jgi:hypothetical protein